MRERLDDAFPIFRRALLRQKELSLELRDFDLDAARELNQNPEEVKWIRTRIEQTLDGASVWTSALAGTFQAMQAKRDALRSVGIVVPTTIPRFPGRRMG